MKNHFFEMLTIVMVVFIAASLTSCDRDDDIEPTTKSSSISKPVVKITSRKANSNYDGWWVIGTVTTGGDSPANVKCYLEWEAFSSKQTGSVSLSHRDIMNVTNSTKNQVQFKKEHAGISGKYIYFRLVGSNSKYTATTANEYMVATTR